MIEKPTISEEVFVINEDLNAHYSVFRNDAVFHRDIPGELSVIH